MIPCIPEQEIGRVRVIIQEATADRMTWCHSIPGELLQKGSPSLDSPLLNKATSSLWVIAATEVPLCLRSQEVLFMPDTVLIKD